MKKENFSEEWVARFEAKIDRSGGPDACHLWLAGKDTHGYGQISHGGRMVLTHRVSFILGGGEFTPDRPFCLHSCHDPGCNNTRHLRAGSQKENMADCVAAGRSNKPKGDANGSRKHPERLARGEAHGSRMHPERLARGETHGSRTKPEHCPRGSANGRSKLTEDKVREIRILLAGGETQVAIAKRYGVSQVQISCIKLGKTWGHVK